MDDFSDLPVASLRRLARGLLFDRSQADDVVQETWLAAIRQQPDRSIVGGWLSGTVRNLASRLNRDQAARHQREERAARAEAQPVTSDVVARLEILRGLLDAVERLDEPYRAAIVMRFLDDLSPREIAKRLDLPVNTVRTHVRRGLERLRRDLDGARGAKRNEFLAALTPLAGRVPWSVALGVPSKSLVISKWTGGILVKSKLVLAVIVLVVLSLSWFALRAQQSTNDSTNKSATTVASTASDAASTQTPKPDSLSQPASESAVRAPVSTAAPTESWILRGVVTRGIYDPFPNARLIGRVVEIGGSPSKPTREVRITADQNGEFSWAMEPPSTAIKVTLASGMDDTIWGNYDARFLQGDPSPTPWVVQLYPLDCTVHCTVRGPDRKPVANARIFEPYWCVEQRTDGDGHFAMRLSSLYPNHRLRVIAEGFAEATIDASRGLGDLSPGERKLPDLILTPELCVRGRVVDESGNGLAAARITAQSPFDQLPAVQTDANGAFAFGKLERGFANINLLASKPGFVRTNLPLAPKDQLDDEVRIVLPRGVKLSGRVLSAAHAPIEGARIKLGPWPWNPDLEGESTYSNPRGEFEFNDVGRGTQYIWVFGNGCVALRHDVEVPATGDHLDDVELVLEQGHFLAGVVQDEHGKPLPWAMVYAEEVGYHYPISFAGTQTWAESDGHFRIDGLPADKVVIGVLAKAHARFTQTITELDRSDIVLTPQRSALLAGKVIDDATGAPITNFKVRVGFSFAGSDAQRPRSLPGTPNAPIAFTANDGCWVIKHDFEANKFVRVAVEADGYAPALLDPVATTIDSTPDSNIARLVHHTLVRGRVVEVGTGAPLANIRVRAFREEIDLRAVDGHDVSETKTDASGRFEFVDIAIGRLSLAVEPEGSPLSVDGPFDLSGSVPVDRVIEAKANSGARIRGRLLDAAGHGLAGETVCALALEVVGDRREWKTTTAEDGAYELKGLPEGAFHLKWTRSRDDVTANCLLQLVELPRDQELNFDLQPKGDATIRGRIQFDGRLPKTLAVTIFPEPTIDEQKVDKLMKWAKSSRATFAENGVFEIDGIQAGRQTTLVSFNLGDSWDRASGSSQVEVPEHGTVDTVVEVKKR